MGRRKKLTPHLIESVTIEKAAAEGFGIARVDGEVIFVEQSAPGDEADIWVYRKKRKTKFASIRYLHNPSPDRVDPACAHFGTCGGCKWQHLSYEGQLAFKQQQVIDQFQRIGGFKDLNINPIKGSEANYYYRNKLEFTFSNSRWLTADELSTEEILDKDALGFHVPKRYDKILQVDHCYLQETTQNTIRNEVFEYAKKNGLDFYGIQSGEGTLRTITFRSNRKGEWMVLLVTTDNQPEKVSKLLQYLKHEYPQITSLFHAVNTKVNDSIYDLEFNLIDGNETLTEVMLGLSFLIRPKSFFQTNPVQAEVLYSLALEGLKLTGKEIIYDLYSGTGTIGLFMANKAKKIIGIESVPDAVEDAKENARRNKIENASFVCGDMRDVFNQDFYNENGAPDIIITDPPRAGMHPKVVEQLLEVACKTIVYISCNPATQARDIQALSEKYDIETLQPVDMFPQTHHIENIAILKLRG